LHVFSERLPIKGFKQDIEPLREFCNGKDKVVVTSLLAPGTCEVLGNISYEPKFYVVGRKLVSEYREGLEPGTIVMQPKVMETHVINCLCRVLLMGVYQFGISPNHKYLWDQVEVDTLLIAIGQAGNDPIVKLLTDAYCLHRFYSGEKEI